MSNLQPSSNWNTLITAVNKRIAVWQAIAAGNPYFGVPVGPIQITDPRTGTVYTSGAPGVPCNLANWWGWSNAYSIQNSIMALLSQQIFIDSTLTYEGNTNVALFPTTPTGSCPAALTLPTIRAAAGLPTTINPAVPTSTPNSWFRRTRSRRIASTSATSDEQTNPAVAGQYAYMIGTGELYLYPGSPPWVRADNHCADVLDNTLGYPNAITNYGLTYFGTVAQLNDIADAQMLFDEATAIIGKMNWAWRGVGGAWPMTYTTHQYDGSYTSYVSWSDAISQLTSRWPSDSIGTPTALPQSYASGSYNSGFSSWNISADKIDTTFTITNLAALLNEVDWLVFGVPFNAINGGTFDAEGDPVLSNKWHIWHTNTGTFGTILTAPKFGDATVFPPNTPSDPATAGDGSKGYQVTNAAAILKFNF